MSIYLVRILDVGRVVKVAGVLLFVSICTFVLVSKYVCTSKVGVPVCHSNGAEPLVCEGADNPLQL